MPPPTAPPDEVIHDRRRWVDHRARHRPLPRWRRGLVRSSGARRAGRRRPWSSVALHRLGDLSANAGTGLAAGLFVVVWVVVGVRTRFPDWWETVLYSVSAAATLVMVFAIQHTQTRQQSATQRKLDELLRSQPDANDQLIAAEDAPDEELQALADLNLADRQRAVRRPRR